MAKASPSGSAEVIQEMREQFLEMAADYLLRKTGRDPERPAYTERQLARKWPRAICLERIPRDASAPQSLRDELRFLMSITRMDQEDRRCLKLWADGWTQQEIAEAYNVRQQVVSYRLQKSLQACYSSAPVSFRKFSQHTIYRKRSRVRTTAGSRRCAECRETFLAILGIGRYCCEECRKAGEIKERLRQISTKVRVDRNRKK